MNETRARANTRANSICNVMPTWSVLKIKADGSIVFEVPYKTEVCYVEFSDEHFDAFEALNKSNPSK